MNRIIATTLICIALASCASTATQQTLPWQRPIQHFTLLNVAPGLYQMDQFVITYEGLDKMLSQEIAKGNRPDIIIRKNLIMNSQSEQVRIAQLVESYGLRIFQESLIGISETSSEKMLSLDDEPESEETEESS